MKNILIAAACLLASAIVSAQDMGGFRTSKLKFNGQEYPCYVKTFETSAEVLENSIENMMKEKGYKNQGKKDYQLYRNISMSSINNGKLTDMLVKVESAGSKKEDKAELFLIVVQAGEISTEKNSKAAAAAGTAGVIGLAAMSSDFQRGMNESVSGGHFDAQTKLLEADMKKEQKKLEDLESENKSLQKRLEKVQQDIQNNQNDIEKQREKLGKARKQLDAHRDTKSGKN